MKKICAIVLSLILVAFAVSVSAVEQTDIIRNDESGIPDRNLYQQLILDFDVNSDGLLQLSEVENVGAILVDGKEINSLKGINYLTNLKIISAGYNNLESLEGVEGLHLHSIFVAHNNLTDISALADMSDTLEEINVSENRLSTLPNFKSFNLTCVDAPQNRSTDFTYNKLTYSELKSKIPDHLFWFHGPGQGGSLDFDWLKVEAMLQEPDLPMGDANEDFKVTIEDTTFIQKYIADLEVIKEWTPQYYAADVNSDGSINIEDAITIQKIVAEITEF